MNSKSLADFAQAVVGRPMPAWQRRFLSELESYYARAEAVGISRADASRVLSVRMEKARSQRRYSSMDALSDAKRALVE